MTSQGFEKENHICYGSHEYEIEERIRPARPYQDEPTRRREHRNDEVEDDISLASSGSQIRFFFSFLSVATGKLKTKFRTNLFFFSYIENPNFIFYVLSLVSLFLEREIEGPIGVQLVSLLKTSEPCVNIFTWALLYKSLKCYYNAKMCSGSLSIPILYLAKMHHANHCG